jgi:hypothetical protein
MNRGDHRIEIPQHLRSGHAQDKDPLSRQPKIPPLIPRRMVPHVMRHPIHLDRQ